MGMNGAGAKHGTISSSNIVRVTGSEVDGSAALLGAATAVEEAGGGTKESVTQNCHSRRIGRRGGTESDYNGSGPSRLGMARNVTPQLHSIRAIGSREVHDAS